MIIQPHIYVKEGYLKEIEKCRPCSNNMKMKYSYL
jgi:hypothetical protein